MPKLYIISGCNGAGKTTASYTLLPEMLECSQFVNSDEFAKGLSPFNPEQASIQASRYMLLKIKYLFTKKEDFGIETTLATRTLLKMISKAQKEGYTVTLMYFWLNSPDLAVARVKARVAAGGHNIPEETVRRRYRVGVSYFFKDYMPLCDRWILADNSKVPFRVIAEGSRDDIINIKDKDTYVEFDSITVASAGSLYVKKGNDQPVCKLGLDVEIPLTVFADYEEGTGITIENPLNQEITGTMLTVTQVADLDNASGTVTYEGTEVPFGDVYALTAQGQ